MRKTFYLLSTVMAFTNFSMDLRATDDGEEPLAKRACLRDPVELAATPKKRMNVLGSIGEDLMTRALNHGVKPDALVAFAEAYVKGISNDSYLRTLRAFHGPWNKLSTTLQTEAIVKAFKSGDQESMKYYGALAYKNVDLDLDNFFKTYSTEDLKMISKCLSAITINETSYSKLDASLLDFFPNLQHLTVNDFKESSPGTSNFVQLLVELKKERPDIQLEINAKTLEKNELINLLGCTLLENVISLDLDVLTLLTPATVSQEESESSDQESKSSQEESESSEEESEFDQYINDNALISGFKASLPRMTNLRALNMDVRYFPEIQTVKDIDEIMDLIKGIPNLRELSLTRDPDQDDSSQEEYINEIIESIAKSIKQMTSIKKINLELCSFGVDEAIYAAPLIEALSHLSLTHLGWKADYKEEATEKKIKAFRDLLKKFPNLESLDLTLCEFLDLDSNMFNTFLEGLLSLGSLKKLDLSYNTSKMDDTEENLEAFNEALKKMVSLEEFNFYGNYFGDLEEVYVRGFFEALAGLPCLTFADLSWNRLNESDIEKYTSYLRLHNPELKVKWS